MNIEEILKKHISEDGTFNQEAAAKEIKEEQGKVFVPKSEFNSKNKELKSANTTLEQLKKDNKDAETLQSQITEHETKVAELQQELADERKTFTIKEALQGAGVQDVDYMMFKLGDVEVNEDGTIKDLDSKVKELSEKHPTFFPETKDDGEAGNDNLGGFEIIDNQLENGKATDPVAKATEEFEQALGLK